MGTPKAQIKIAKATGRRTVGTLAIPAASDPMADKFREIIELLGEDSSRSGLLKTPERVARSLRFLTSGYHQDPNTVLNGALYEVTYDEMVIVKDIEIFSLCEHHLLPFFGRCHVAYIPSKKVVGLSKLPRLVDVFARRLQIQERLTNQVAQTIMENIHPLGVGVVIEARHLCMIMRGVEKQNSVAVTSAMLGVFRTSQRTREEFLKLMRGGR
jgi:GTP cyclohydrolase I